MAKEILGIDSGVLKEIKNIFKETNIEEIEMEETEGYYIKVSRKKPEVQVVNVATPVAGMPVAPASAPAPAATTESAPAPAATTSDYDNEDKYCKITSPVIGTYYEASTPGAAAFVKTGDTVSPDSTVCIVEAMKVMNEIKAEVKGQIVEIKKSNGDSVLSGEVMFIVEKG